MKSIFGALGPAELEYARLHLRRRHVAAGALLYLAGEPCAGLFLVQRGALRLYIEHAGKEQTLRVVPQGETCNEVAACSGATNPASAQAIDDGDILVLSPECVSYLVGRSDQFARALLATMAERTRHFVALVGDLSFHHVTGRVAKVLLQSVAPAPGVGAGMGGRTFTQQELADLVGTAREVVARSLRALQTDGAIAQVRGRVVVLDRRLLAEAVEEPYRMATRTSKPVSHRPYVIGALSPTAASAPPASAGRRSSSAGPLEFAARMATAPAPAAVPA